MKYQTATKSEQAGPQQSACCGKPLSSDQSVVHQFRQLHQTIGNREVGRLIQTKLTVSEPGDSHEQEADRVADEVMRMAAPAHNTAVPQIQRKCDSCEEEEISRKTDEEEKEEETPVQRKAANQNASPNSSFAKGEISTGNGQSLPASARSFFEPRFGSDLSDVRIHADAEAARTASDLGARAFTTGRDVFFNSGQYAPDAFEGRRLIAHELTHVFQQNEAGETQIHRQGDGGGPTHVFIFGGVPDFLDCSRRDLDSVPDTSCCSGHTRSLIPGLYTRSREHMDRAIQRMADGANMDGAIARHFGSDALSERSEILSRLRLIRAELNKESTHTIRCRIALTAANSIGYDLLQRVDGRLFCQSNVQASARVGGTVATLCVDIHGSPAGGWSTLLHEMVHLSGVGNLPDRSAATTAQTSAREYETYEHERGAGLYPNPMPFSLRNADSYSSFVEEIGAESWSAEGNVAAYLPSVGVGGLMSFEGAPRFGLTGSMMWTPFGSNIQPLIGARALWLPRRDADVPPAVQPTDMRAYVGGELGFRWITGGPRVQFVLDVAGGAGPYVTVDENVDLGLMARLGLGVRFGGPRAAFGVSTDVMRLFHIDNGSLVGTSADDWFGGLSIRGHWGGTSTTPR